MTSRSYADQLDDAADRIADISRADLQIMLRRAALRLRNKSGISFDENVDEALAKVATEFGVTRNDLVRRIVREGLQAMRYLPVHDLDEDGDIDGRA